MRRFLSALPLWPALALVAHVGGQLRAAETVPTARGVEVQIGSVWVEAAADPSGALRLSVSRQPGAAPARSIFLAPTVPTLCPWKRVHDGAYVGVGTQEGALLIDPSASRWELRAADGRILIGPSPLNFPADATSVPELTLVLLDASRREPLQAYGSGNAVPHLLQSEGRSRLGNGLAVVPYYWSPSGYAALGVTASDLTPARWKAIAADRLLIWTFPGDRADLYLMPSRNLKAAARAYAALSGAPPVPPLWTFGYLQSRWGWKDRAYIDETLLRFRSDELPVDAFIFDFEWYTTHPDYRVPPKGLPGFTDFGWNPRLFPEPKEQIAGLRADGLRFVGIRKPRLGNSALLRMLRTKGWNLFPGDAARMGYQARDLNFANPELRRWYAAQIAPLLRDGVAGWWNDEGEATYNLYYYWNLAEIDALLQVRPQGRFWSLNRAFMPGLQRLGAAAWTGDIDSTWKALQQTPASLLNWSLAGMPYGACDIGGFHGEDSPELLVRWMQAGVFFPVMRSHSVITVKPRFPWLYGADAEHAIRDALDLRYRLIPLYYSLAHAAHETGVPLMRPLAMEFPGDAALADLTDEWMMGDQLLAAPVLAPGGLRQVVLPPGIWYPLGEADPQTGGRVLRMRVGLDDIPVWIRAGSILPLGPVVPSTADWPGGPLEVQVYPGRDAAFTLVEDDGSTTDYLEGDERRTSFRWDDVARRLTWSVSGPYHGPDLFSTMSVRLMAPSAPPPRTAALGAPGAVVFSGG